MKFLLKVTVVLFVSIMAFGCDYHFGNYQIRNQADLDSFAENGYTTILGSLFIWDTDLTNLNGLESLETASNISMLNNELLTDLSALSNLTSRLDSLYVEDNPMLEDLDGLENVASIGEIGLENNDSLTNIDALSDCLASEDSLGGSVYIIDNDALVDIEGFSNVTSAGWIEIIDNDQLTTIEGLRNLTKVSTYNGKNLWPGLIGSGDFIITGNPLLTTLGLDNLTRVRTSFKITDNAELCTSLAEELDDQVTVGLLENAEIEISGNKDCP